MSQGSAEVNSSPILLLKSMDSNPRGSFISPRNPCPRVLKLNPPYFFWIDRVQSQQGGNYRFFKEEWMLHSHTLIYVWLASIYLPLGFNLGIFV
jgi:hypothetical protein